MVFLSHLDFDGQGQLLEVGCGSGAIVHPGGPHHGRGKSNGHGLLGCGLWLQPGYVRENAASEGVAARCPFQHGDANNLDFPDEL